MPIKKDTSLTRFGVSIPTELIRSFDAYVQRNEYTSRSEAIRDIIREKLIEEAWSSAEEGKEVVGTITYVYDHHKRELVDSIIDIQHDFSGLVLATQHVHLDHANCLEVAIVRGDPASLTGLANKLKALKGIKHCQMTMTTTGADLS